MCGIHRWFRHRLPESERERGEKRMAEERTRWERAMEEERERGRQALEQERIRGERALNRATKAADQRHRKAGRIWRESQESERAFWAQMCEQERRRGDQERARLRQENAHACQLVLRQRDARRPRAGRSDAFRTLSGAPAEPPNPKKRSASS